MLLTRGVLGAVAKTCEAISKPPPILIIHPVAAKGETKPKGERRRRSRSGRGVPRRKPSSRGMPRPSSLLPFFVVLCHAKMRRPAGRSNTEACRGCAKVRRLHRSTPTRTNMLLLFFLLRRHKKRRPSGSPLRASPPAKSGSPLRASPPARWLTPARSGSPPPGRIRIASPCLAPGEIRICCFFCCVCLRLEKLCMPAGRSTSRRVEAAAFFAVAFAAY